MRKLTKYMTGILFGTFVLGTTAFAAEVTPVSGVGFTTENTEVKTEASAAGALVLTKEQCPDNIGVAITGVTDNGFWEVDLGQEQKFYIEGAGLVNVTGSGTETEKTTGNINSQTDSVGTIDFENDTLFNAVVEEYKKDNIPYYYRGYLTEQNIKDLKQTYIAFSEALNKAMASDLKNTPFYSDTVMPYYDGLTGIYANENADLFNCTREVFRKTYPDFTFFHEYRDRRICVSRNGYLEGWFF